MDLYTQLTNSLEEMSSMFSDRMQKYDDDLKNATTSESSHKSIQSLSRDFTEFKCLIWKTVGMLKKQIELLTKGLDKHEMLSRRNMLLVHGVAEQNDINCILQITKLLTDKLKISDFSASDIQTCHRLGTNTNKPRPILIRFHNYAIRNEVWRKKTLLKGTKLTISEFLTKTRHDVFVSARKHFGMKQCWSSEGKIVIQLPDKTRRKVEYATELHNLITQFPSPQSDQTARPVIIPVQEKRPRKGK